jgi:CubicO group peptidase (beta-lactamase class C family)
MREAHVFPGNVHSFMNAWGQLRRAMGLGLQAYLLVFRLDGLPAQVDSSLTTSDPAEDQARQLLAVINADDAAAAAEFARGHFSERALQETPVEEIVALFRKMKAQSGGLDIAKVLPPEMPGQANLLLRSRTGPHFVRLVVFTRDGKLTDFFPLAATDPNGDISTDWPTNRVSNRRIHHEIERHAEFASSRDLFSGVVLVADGPRICFQKAYGLAEKSFASPNRLDTRFNLGSLDKMFTGLAIAQLEADGKLSFDDKLAKVLPDYPNPTSAGKITIHQLLTHTSGLGDALKPEMREKKKKFVTVRDYFPLFVNDPLLFEPGSQWSYSNAGYVVLGAVIEKLSGESYFDYVREHVFAPAGMRDTGYFELDQVVPNLAVGYGRFDDDVLGIGLRRNNGVFLGYKGNSAGGGYSTAGDLLRFARALREHHLLSPELTELVTSGKVSAAGDRYGYGFWQWSRFGHSDVRGNSGGGPSSGIDSELQMFWNGPYTVIVMSNYDAPSGTSLARAISEFLSRQLL